MDASVRALLQQHPFQNLNLSVKDGEVVSLSQEVTIMPRGGLVRSKRGGGRSTQLSHQRVRFPNRSDRRRHLSPELDGADADPAPERTKRSHWRRHASCSAPSAR